MVVEQKLPQICLFKYLIRHHILTVIITSQHLTISKTYAKENKILHVIGDHIDFDKPTLHSFFWSRFLNIKPTKHIIHAFADWQQQQKNARFEIPTGKQPLLTTIMHCHLPAVHSQKFLESLQYIWHFEYKKQPMFYIILLKCVIFSVLLFYNNS